MSRDAAAPGGAPHPHCVADIALFLAGRWRIARRIEDMGRAATGTLTGTACFSPIPGGLRQHEGGRLRFGSYRGEATTEQTLSLAGPGIADVLFADGRLFHRLDLSSGVAEVTHDCGADHYCGRYCVRGPDLWMLNWTITGPRKQMRIATRYRRAGPAQ